MSKGYPEPLASLSDTEITSILTSLKILRENIDENGELAFCGLFQTYVESNTKGDIFCLGVFHILHGPPLEIRKYPS